MILYIKTPLYSTGSACFVSGEGVFFARYASIKGRRILFWGILLARKPAAFCFGSSCQHKSPPHFVLGHLASTKARRILFWVILPARKPAAFCFEPSCQHERLQIVVKTEGDFFGDGFAGGFEGLRVCFARARRGELERGNGGTVFHIDAENVCAHAD